MEDQAGPAKRKPYSSDLSDEQWDIIEPLIPENDGPGDNMHLELREVVNAVLYVTKNWIRWRDLPHDFPNYNSVYYHFNKWSRNGTLEQINDALRAKVRQKEGRDPPPTGGIIDSQSVKTTETVDEEKGFDGGKLVKGRKRHYLTDTIGLLIKVVVKAANKSDKEGAMALLQAAAAKGIKLLKIWADSAYQGMVEWAKEKFGIDVEIVRADPDKKGFHVQKRRWVVERSISWFTQPRRLAKDYERQVTQSAGMIYMASIALMLNRLAPCR
jgi:putative transposase